LGCKLHHKDFVIGCRRFSFYWWKIVWGCKFHHKVGESKCVVFVILLILGSRSMLEQDRGNGWGVVKGKARSLLWWKENMKECKMGTHQDSKCTLILVVGSCWIFKFLGGDQTLSKFGFFYAIENILKIIQLNGSQSPSPPFFL